MGKWLAKFLGDTHEKEPHIPHTLPDSATVWGLSVPLSGTLPGIRLSQVVEPPASPLPTYCFVTYTDRQGRLCGGWDERATSTVKRCHGTGQGCEVELNDGRRIPLRSIRAVGQTNQEGWLVAAWSVREQGFDGKRTKPNGDYI
jgi:hypothetical protein